MRVAVINLTGGGMSGGYRKYLRNVLSLMSKHDDVETIVLNLILSVFRIGSIPYRMSGS